MEEDPLSLEEQQIPGLDSIEPFTNNFNSVSNEYKDDIFVEGNEVLTLKNTGKYDCSICDTQCENYNDLKIHLKSHKDVKLYECIICHKEYPDSIKLFGDLKIDEPDLYQCFSCEEVFGTINSLNIHMDINHSDIEFHKCKNCVKNKINVHSSVIFEKNEKSYYCNFNLCKQEFKNKTEFNKHMKDIHQSLYKCSDCIKCFNNQKDLDIHKDSHNSIDRPFKCKFCKETFACQLSLQLHISKEHNKKNEAFKCTLCEYSFEKSTKLNTHMLVHADESPFECPDCADLFEDLKMYQTHMKSHDSDRERQIENVNKNEVIVGTMGKDSKQSNIDFIVIFNDLQNKVISEVKHQTKDESNIDLNVVSESSLVIMNYDIDETSPSPMTRTKTKKQLSETNKIITEDGIVMRKTENPRKVREPVSLAWQEKDNKVRPYKCNLCNRSYTLAGTLSLHNRRTHLGIKPYACKVCEWTFAQSSDLIKHTRKHSGERPYRCKFCGMGFTQNRNLKNHMKMHTEQPSVCKYCNKKFAIDTSLTQHLKKHEGSNVTYCKFCGIPFTYESDLKTHMKRNHKDDKPHKCTSCPKAFAKSCDLKKHTRIHSGERPYSCSICSKTFTHPTSLRNHRVVHTGEKEYICSFCGQAFAFSGNLKVHIRSHSGERPFKCNICNKAFARTANLNEHTKIHTGIKSHKCVICDKSFTNSSTFSKHKKIHSGDRPHKCLLCNKAFIQYAHLTKHIRVHTGEKPFFCNICNKYFRRSDTLSSHIKTHNRVDESQQLKLQDRIHLDIIQTKIEVEPPNYEIIPQNNLTAKTNLETSFIIGPFY